MYRLRLSNYLLFSVFKMAQRPTFQDPGTFVSDRMWPNKLLPGQRSTGSLATFLRLKPSLCRPKKIIFFEHPHPKAAIAKEMYCFPEDWGLEQYRVWCENDALKNVARVCPSRL